MSSTSGRGRPHSLRKRRPHSLPLHRMNQVHALLLPSWLYPGPHCLFAYSSRCGLVMLCLLRAAADKVNREKRAERKRLKRRHLHDAAESDDAAVRAKLTAEANRKKGRAAVSNRTAVGSLGVQRSMVRRRKGRGRLSLVLHRGCHQRSRLS